MVAYIWFDLQRKIKNPRSLFVIVLILIMSFQKIGDFNIKSRKSADNSLYNRAGTIESIGKSGISSYVFENPNEIGEITNPYKLIEDTGIKMKIAIKDNDYKEYNKLSCFGNLLIAKSIIAQENKLREMSFNKQVVDIWNEVSDGIYYDDVIFQKGRPKELHFYYMFLIEAKHDYSLYKENLVSLDPYYIDSLTFIYMYLNEVLPLIIGFIILILTFDSINGEWSKGSLKMILTNMFSRSKYLISKIIIGTLYTTFVVTLPALIISLGYGLFNGFNNYNYPVLYLKKGFQTLSSIPNYIEFDQANVAYNGNVGLSFYSGIPKGEMGVSNKLALMPLYKLLLLASVILIFCIIFYVVINILISSMIKNQIIGFIISIIITIVGIVISKPWTMNRNHNLSPFSMNNPVRILSGTYNATGLASILILMGVSLLLVIFNLKYYSSKDL